MSDLEAYRINMEPSSPEQEKAEIHTLKQIIGSRHPDRSGSGGVEVSNPITTEAVDDCEFDVEGQV